MALCRMVSYNIAHLAFLNAKRYNINRVFFGGFFIRGHRHTMNVISYAISFWSKREMTALYLRHEGFLGVMGAFLKVNPNPLKASAAEEKEGPRRSQVPPAAAAADMVFRLGGGFDNHSVFA